MNLKSWPCMHNVLQPERVRSLSNEDWDNAKQRPSIFRMAQHHMFANSQGAPLSNLTHSRGAARGIMP